MPHGAKGTTFARRAMPSLELRIVMRLRLVRFGNHELAQVLAGNRDSRENVRTCGDRLVTRR
jgi:hypothetical protein